MQAVEESPPQAVDKSGHRVRRMFGEIAGRYDFMNHLLSGGVDYYWRWRTVRRFQLIAGQRVLDVCTGTGDLALAWLKRGRGDVSVVGTDFTHEMLQIANEKAAGAKGDIAFMEADTQYLPFPDNDFNIVSVAFGLRNVSDTRRGLREMLRVCRPGGHVVVLEFSEPRNRLFRSIYLWYFKNVLPRLGQLFAKNRESAYDYLPASVSEFPHGQQLADIMQECGFEAVTFTPLTFGIATLYIGRKPEVAGAPV